MNNNLPYVSGGYEVSTWYMHQIFDGVQPIVMGVSNYVVPVVGDFVLEMSNTIINRYRVVKVVGRISTLERVYDATNLTSTIDLTTEDYAYTSMVLMRTDVQPVLAAVHIGLPIESDINLGYAKLFTGRDINDLEAIVSRNYDTDGKVIDDKIKISQDPINQFSYRTEQFYIDRILEDRSIGTIVFYGIDNTPLGKYNIVFRESNSLVNYSNTELFIEDLVLESSQLNPMNPKEILVRRGFLNATFNPRIFKVFNTGQREEVALTNNRITLEGWGAYVLGSENDTFPLSVQYTLAANELADVISDEMGEVITVEYTVRIVDDEDSINYKLYPVVQWNTDTSKYTLSMWLYDSTYKTDIDVTNLVSLSTPFDDADFLHKQEFNFSLDTKELALTSYGEFVTGSFAISLKAVPMGANTPFEVYMVAGDDGRAYGTSLRARATRDLGSNVLSIDSDYTMYDEWLEDVYYKLLPVYDSNIVDRAPAPDICDVYIGDDLVTMDILTQWNVGVKIPNIPSDDVSTVRIVWYSYDEDNSRNYLATSSMQLEVV